MRPIRPKLGNNAIGSVVDPTKAKSGSTTSTPLAGRAPIDPALIAALTAVSVKDPEALLRLAQVLRTAPLISTTPAIEDAAASAASAIKKGHPADVEALVAAGRASGADGLRALGVALTAHLEAHDALGTDAGRALLEAVGLGALESVAAHRPTSTADALAKMVSMSELARLGFYKGSAYSAGFVYSNEPGLVEAAKTLTVRGGAAIGVSGGLLELAIATRADAVVLVDVDAYVGSFVLAIAALLLGMDHVEPQLDDNGRAAKLRQLLAGEVDPLIYLASAGLPSSELIGVRRALVGNSGRTAPSNAWVHSSEGVAHLSKLAREGRMTAIVGDWADPKLGPRIVAALEGLGTQVGSVNFSNMLDYVVDHGTFRQNLACLPAMDGAEVMGNSFYYGTEKTIADFYGTFDKPKAGPFSGWARGDFIERLLKAKSEPPYNGARPLDGDKLAEYRDDGRTKGHEAFATRNAAWKAMSKALEDAGLGELTSYLYPPRKFQLPRSSAEIPALLHQLDRTLLTEEDRLAVAQSTIQSPTREFTSRMNKSVIAAVRRARSASEVFLLLALAQRTIREERQLR